MPHETEIIIKSGKQPVAFGDDHHTSALPKPTVRACAIALLLVGVFAGLFIGTLVL